MDQYLLEAVETLGYWQINLNRRYQREDGAWESEKVYRGHHVPIDEEDPLVRTVLLLHQVVSDCEVAIVDNTDTLVDRRPSH